MALKRDPKLKAELEKQADDGLSPLHAYMRANHEALSVSLDRPLAKWAEAAAAIAALGVLGSKGQVPTAEAVRSMWPRIKRQIAEAEKQKLQSQPSRKPPNRSPRTTLPLSGVLSVTPSPPPVRTPPPPPQLAPAASNGVPDGAAPTLTPEAEAKFAKLRQQLAKADRYLGLPITGKNS
jgi:hypothetical protein